MGEGEGGGIRLVFVFVTAKPLGRGVNDLNLPSGWMNGDSSGINQTFVNQNFSQVVVVQMCDFDRILFRIGPVNVSGKPIYRQTFHGLNSLMMNELINKFNF